jgi:MFS transporter, UMF1 family
LVAYFFYSDSYSTIVTVGVLLMRDVMCMKPLHLGIILVEVMLLAVVGNALALRIQRRFKIQPKYMIAGCLSGYMFLCAFSLLGLIRNSPVGLKSIPEAYLFAAVHGLIIGAVQSYSRTVFCDLVIPGKEAESFALYEITDKGSSWLGSFPLCSICFPVSFFPHSSTLPTGAPHPNVCVCWGGVYIFINYIYIYRVYIYIYIHICIH